MMMMYLGALIEARTTVVVSEVILIISGAYYLKNP